VTDAPRSVAFDRAAEYYDATRGLDEEGNRLQTDLLLGELAGKGLVLEVGVGTGQVALPLHEAGVPLVGLDLARPMMDKLVEKSGGLPFPLMQADATRMPFADDAFDGAYLRWVLHLIPAWETALAEMVRVLRPEGVVCALLGAYGGVSAQIQDRFSEITGIDHTPVGLGWNATDELDRAMAALGRRARALPRIEHRVSGTAEAFLRGIEEDRYSWTWRLSDDVRLRAARELRPWAEERFGDLSTPVEYEVETSWRAYDST
jgi:ubiquinone/menaquinone biosynthesis C-methylase UbiE